MTWRLADLTMPISPGMLVNPDHFPPEISTYATLDSHGWEARRLVLDSHLGTHLDAPSHFVADTATVDQADLAVLIGDAQVIHLAGVTPGEVITAARLGPVTGRRVLLDTGWSARGLGQAEYFGRAPYLAPDCARALLDAGHRAARRGRPVGGSRRRGPRGVAGRRVPHRGEHDRPRRAARRVRAHRAAAAHQRRRREPGAGGGQIRVLDNYGSQKSHG